MSARNLVSVIRQNFTEILKFFNDNFNALYDLYRIVAIICIRLKYWLWNLHAYKHTHTHTHTHTHNKWLFTNFRYSPIHSMILSLETLKGK